MNARLLVGTSGFAYADWKPRFYPAELAQAKMLAHYATRLDAVEINYTFNRFPTQSLLEGWNSKTPERFAFCLKAPRRISHERKLRECTDEIVRLTEPILATAERMGPVLVQTPPSLKSDPEALTEFLAHWPKTLKIAFEFRNTSWDNEQVLVLLRSAGAAWVAAEDETTPAVHRDTGTDFAYLRLRRNAYDADTLGAWSKEISQLRGNGLDVWCFLRHDADGSNALAAQQLRQLQE